MPFVRVMHRAGSEGKWRIRDVAHTDMRWKRRSGSVDRSGRADQIVDSASNAVIEGLIDHPAQ